MNISYEAFKIKEALKTPIDLVTQDNNAVNCIDSSQKNQSDFYSSQLMNEGLARISDELERKRKSDEYYLLLNLIDSIETKLIKLGKNLRDVYSKIQLNNKNTISLENSEILMILHTFYTKEQREWLKATSKLYQLDPLDILFQLFTDAEVKFLYITKRTEDSEYLYNELNFYAKTKVELEKFDEYIFISKCYKNYEGTILSDGVGIIFKDDKNQCYYKIKEKVFPLYEWIQTDEILTVEESKDNPYNHFLRQYNKESSWDSTDYKIKLDIDAKIEILKALKKLYEKKEFLSIDEMKNVTEFKNFISQINCDIILNNLRNLHDELSIAYKNAKFEIN